MRVSLTKLVFSTLGSAAAFLLILAVSRYSYAPGHYLTLLGCVLIAGGIEFLASDHTRLYPLLAAFALVLLYFLTTPFVSS